MKYIFILFSFVMIVGALSAQSLDDLYKKGEYASSQNDYVTAVSYYRKAAKQHYSKAQIALGQCYEWGQGVNKNLKQAKEWYFKAAEQGETVACYRLGYVYYYEDNNYKEAVKWLTKGTEMQNKDWPYWACKIAMGVCYRDGNGVEKNTSRAYNIINDAFLQCSDDDVATGVAASGHLSWLYYKGIGVKKDWVKAKDYLEHVQYMWECNGYWPYFMTDEEYNAMYKDLNLKPIPPGPTEPVTSVPLVWAEPTDFVKQLCPDGGVGLISILRGEQGKIGNFSVLLDAAGNLSLGAQSSIMFVGQADKLENVGKAGSYKGMSNTMFLKQGCGYVICLQISNATYYYRLYVNDYVLDENNKNIGIEISYQAYKKTK